jgi:hypothetical protein
MRGLGCLHLGRVGGEGLDWLLARRSARVGFGRVQVSRYGAGKQNSRVKVIRTSQVALTRCS